MPVSIGPRAWPMISWTKQFVHSCLSRFSITPSIFECPIVMSCAYFGPCKRANYHCCVKQKPERWNGG
ncbi:unnamed protein product [Echinostoma caproni]|uniref:Uncharacterized protein n=1 Tax=Echinostoma caproni TaxID=27848 RepID=A0A3P8HBT4_9TREM|nr:unnamed protein product [Echinostoma caproni]